METGFSPTFLEALKQGEYQSGQLGQTVNLLSYDFRGSNPLSPTLQAEALAKACDKGRPSPRLRPTSGSSSVGRAIAFQAIGREFEPRFPLSIEVKVKSILMLL
jgi:hypothetical protein